MPIATWTGFITDTDAKVEFYIQPCPGSVTFDADPGYSGPDSGEDLQTLVTPGAYTLPDFIINGGEDGPYQSRSWGEVKALYR